MCLRCRLFLRRPNVPPGDCLPGVQPVYLVSDPNCRRLLVRGTACLYGFANYLQGTVVHGCNMKVQFPNLPNGTVGQGCRKFIWFLNLLGICFIA